MKKVVLRSLVIMLGILLMGMVMSCDENKDNPPENGGKVIEEKYRGIFKELVDPNIANDPHMLLEKNKYSVYNTKAELEAGSYAGSKRDAWTVGSDLYVIRPIDGVMTESSIGYFENKDKLIMTLDSTTWSRIEQ